MPNTTTLNRRHLFQTSLASLSLGAVGLRARAAAAPAVVVSTGVNVVTAARAALARAGAHITHRDVVGVADFGQPSSQPRLHLIDIVAGRITSLLVAHGKGSDPNQTGWLSAFSNTPGSDATSQGAYLTGDYYDGAHGRSMHLEGLEPTNSNAHSRAIVVHSAWYVAPDMIKSRGMIGRSEGCFAVNQADLHKVLTRLGPGRLLLATKL